MRLGIFTKVWSRPTLQQTLDEVVAAGVDCVQFNMESVGLAPMPDEIPARVIEGIVRETSSRRITLASVQGTFNMAHPDAEFRQAGLRRLRGIAEVAQQTGAPNIAICVGTRDRNNMWHHHPDNRLPAAWADMVDTLRRALEVVEPLGLTLAFEPEVNNIADTAKAARRLLDEIKSDHLKVTMDAANLFQAGDLMRMNQVLDDAFALIGRDIVLAHAKDLSHDGDAGHEPAGRGKLDYPRYISLLRQYGFSGSILLHGLPETLAPECVDFMRRQLAR